MDVTVSNEQNFLTMATRDLLGMSHDRRMWLSYAEFAFDQKMVKVVMDLKGRDLLALDIGGTVSDEAKRIL